MRKKNGHGCVPINFTKAGSQLSEPMGCSLPTPALVYMKEIRGVAFKTRLPNQDSETSTLIFWEAVLAKWKSQTSLCSTRLAFSVWLSAWNVNHFIPTPWRGHKIDPSYLIYSLTHVFTQQIFIQHLLCARDCLRCWGCRREQVNRITCYVELMVSYGKTPVKSESG